MCHGGDGDTNTCWREGGLPSSSGRDGKINISPTIATNKCASSCECVISRHTDISCTKVTAENDSLLQDQINLPKPTGYVMHHQFNI